MEDSDDWIIDAHGFYIATRSFLMRRGFCCANQCRNCPYINWRYSPQWEPLPAEMVQITTVSAKAIEGARQALAYHAQLPEEARETQDMIAHYRMLLERWEEAGENSSS